MKALFLLVLSGLGLMLSAQSTVLRVEPANVVKEVIVDDLDGDYQDITTVTVTNTSRRDVRLVPRTRVEDAPRNWRYGVFSRKNYVSPYPMDKADLDEGRPLELAAGRSATFVVVLEPRGTSGQGTVEIEFTDLNLSKIALQRILRYCITWLA